MGSWFHDRSPRTRQTRVLNDLPTTRPVPTKARWLLAPLVLLPALLGPANAIDVRMTNGQLTVHANEEPLTEVLDRIAEQTGTRVVYQGPRPSPLVTVAFENLPELEALSRILEGLGLNHIFQMDASGTRVEMLIVDEAFGSGPSTAVSQHGPPTRTFPDPTSPSDLPAENGSEYEAPGEDVRGPDDGSLAQGSLPAIPTARAPQNHSPGTASPDVGPPEFPAEASTPIPSGSLAPPVFPRDASQP
jgi:hypothetical protein